MSQCAICGHRSARISRTLGLCSTCILADTPQARARVAEAHAKTRRAFGLPVAPPRASDGTTCTRCANACRIAEGHVGYCGVRVNEDGVIAGGDPSGAAVSWYHDPLPTNCVADWVCPAHSGAGYPRFTDTHGPELGYNNLAVFYEACTFNCLFCQNWHFRQRGATERQASAAELAAAVNDRTRCICFFGGDPSCQIDHALATARIARKHRGDAILRICWETNGSMSRSALEQVVELSLDSGGTIKFDLKAWDEPLHRALCGASRRRTFENFEYLSRFSDRRPDPPLMVASTLLVPGYVDEQQVAGIASFLSAIDPNIPYALLAFHPAFAMSDLPVTSRDQAERCLSAAQAAGLTRTRLGNIHLLR